MDLIHQNGNRLFVTSLEISNRFAKQHKDVLRAIRDLECSPEFNRRNFAPVEYQDGKGEKRPAYEITRDGFTFLCMGFTGPQAALWKERYIEAFNRMEAALRGHPAALPAVTRVRELEVAVDTLTGEIHGLLSNALQAERRESRLLRKIITLQDKQHRLLMVAERRNARETIITLAREGVPRDVIQQLTGRTYNHIRQVIWQDKQGRPYDPAEQAQSNLVFEVVQ